MKQIFLILIGSLFFLSSFEQINYNTAIGKGDSLYKAGKFGEAIDLYLAAQAFNPLKKDTVKQNIKKVYTKITGLQKEADRQRDTAIILAHNLDSTNREIQKAKDSIYKITLSNAPYKYLRLIRDGPKDADKIKSDSFDIKLIVYCDHLDTLGKKIDSILATKDTITVNKNEYNDLKEKLYYNNDLYEKIYYCFRSQEKEASVLDTVKYSFGNTKITPVILANGKKVVPVAKAIRGNLSFLATEDNYILVSDQSGETKKLRDAIAMGTRVTALDFDSTNSIIYFGTISGDIGFIRYGDTSARRNQPVYDEENALGSRITAMEVFKYQENNFLLATAEKGKAAVYKIDSNFLKPGNKFSGNFLPHNESIDKISNAKFDPSIDTLKNIVLQTTSISGTSVTYLWNPFAKTALEAYKISMRKIIENNKENYDEKLCNMMANNKFY